MAVKSRHDGDYYFKTSSAGQWWSFDAGWYHKGPGTIGSAGTRSTGSYIIYVALGEESTEEGVHIDLDDGTVFQPPN